MASFQSKALKLYVRDSSSPESGEGCRRSLFKKISEALLCISENIELIKQDKSLEILLHENKEENPYIINNNDFGSIDSFSPFAQLPSK